MRTKKVKKALIPALLAVMTLVSLGGCIIAHYDDDSEHHHLHHFYFGHD